MNDVNKLLLDLSIFSPSDNPAVVETMKEAAERIRYLSAEMHNASCVVDRLQRDKIILRDALVKLVGVSTPAELEQMKKSVEAVITLGGDSYDTQAALAGINALLDTQ